MASTDTEDRRTLPCWRPDCTHLVAVRLDAASPFYCSPACERTADREYEAAKEKVRRLRAMLHRSRYWVAAFGRGDASPTSGPEQVARDALIAAQGTLRGLELTGGPETEREQYIAEALTALISAVEPLVTDTPAVSPEAKEYTA